jgi:glucose/arabinose dehydrogenase
MRSIPFLLLAVCAAARAYEFNYDSIVSGVNHPTAMVFINDTTALLTERAGKLRYVRDGQLDPEPVAGVPQVHVAGQAGLFDIALDPQFGSNGTIYLSYADGVSGSNTLAVAAARLDGNQLAGLRVIFRAQPGRSTSFHYGGRLVFLPDGTMLISSGEGFEYREKAQFLDTHFGKTLRIHSDGSVPIDNPFRDTQGALPEIFSYGHRNPQGLVLGAGGEIYMHEHGPRGGDELNLIEPGKNFGWPAITHGVDYSGAYVSPFSSYPGLEQPLLHWTPSIAPAGMTMYDGREFSEWRGNLLVAALVEKSVRRVVLDGREVVAQEILFSELDRRLRDVRTGPGGEIYLLTDYADGEVIRVTAK